MLNTPLARMQQRRRTAAAIGRRCRVKESRATPSGTNITMARSNDATDSPVCINQTTLRAVTYGFRALAHSILIILSFWMCHFLTLTLRRAICPELIASASDLPPSAIPLLCIDRDFITTLLFSYQRTINKSLVLPSSTGACLSS